VFDNICPHVMGNAARADRGADNASDSRSDGTADDGAGGRARRAAHHCASGCPAALIRMGGRRGDEGESSSRIEKLAHDLFLPDGRPFAVPNAGGGKPFHSLFDGERRGKAFLQFA
jgi:hypothetical protein